MTRDPVDWPRRDPLSHRTAATPDRTAVVDVPTGREWTYRAFDGLVDGARADLGARLIDDGWETDDERTPRIGLLASTRIGFVVAFHAGLRAGAALVPLDVRLSERELHERVARVDPALLVCERDTEDAAVAAADCPVVSLDEPGSGRVHPLRTRDTKARGHGPERENGTGSIDPTRWTRHGTAVLLFTSGTTGDPKCVRLTLGNLVASATASAFRLGVSPGDRWLDCLPAYHMGGLAPLLRCPLYGTTLVVGEGFDAGGTAEAMGEYGVTGVSLVPTQLVRLLDDGWRPPASLETVLLGGAPASEELVIRALDAGVPVSPTYGLTEAASQVATATPGLAREQPGSVGQPLVFTEVTVVGDDGRPVGAGETGEIVIDGPTVTPGYLDGDRTAEAFGEYGLHTRDMGYCDADGRLWVLGRADDAIVTGGETVHPADVEAVLCEHPEVTDAAVVGLPDVEWGERVGVAVVASGDLIVEDIESFARERLAGYKVPRTVAFVGELPRTASGTVDRDAVRGLLE